MSDENQVFGRQGEQDAANWAEKLGFTLMEKNYRTPHGEIDLILRSPEGDIVFAEVKSRTGTFFGYPEAAVTPRKKQHIIRAAFHYLEQHYPESDEIPWRIDIISLIYKKDRKTIRDRRWFENVTADE